MRCKTTWLVLALILSLTAAECGPDMVGPDRSSTTSDAAFAGTTMYLGLEQTIVEIPVNGTGYNLTTAAEAKNLTVTERNTTINISSQAEYWRGVHTYRLKFPPTKRAMLRFELAAFGQQFISPVLVNGPLRVVLPAGYTTGDRLMGIARPPPDQTEVLTGPQGNRTALIWSSTPGRQVEVDFYAEKAPRALLMSLLLLAVLAILVAADYVLSVRRMREARGGEDMLWLRGRRGRRRG